MEELLKPKSTDLYENNHAYKLRGTENYIKFTDLYGQNKMYRYSYMTTSGHVFTCVAGTLADCRRLRNNHIRTYKLF